jgi:HSP20 family protein
MNTYLEKRNNSRNPLRFNLDSFFDYDWPGINTKLPAVNVAENDSNFTVEVVAPGFKKDDFKLKVEDDILTITGETKQENKENGNNDEYTRREYSYSSFTRSFRLPDNINDNAISANYTDGILKLQLPKSKKQVTATKEIAIQ